MFRNYLKTAWRNIKVNKLFTILNVAGLAIGLCICILLSTYSAYELSYDKMYKNADKIYRINMETSAKYNHEQWAEIPNAVGPAIVKDIPGVECATRLIKHAFGSSVSLKVNENTFVEKGLYLADSVIFKIFDFDFIEGSAITAFQQPHSIVISQSAQKRLFGSQKSVGKIICINGKDTLHVSGVYKDLPQNSVIDCDMIYNILDSWMGKEVYWSNASYETYCLLFSGENVTEIQNKATMLIDKYVTDKNNKYFDRFLFQPLTKIHLYSSGIKSGYSSNIGDIKNVKSLLFLSLLVLLIACVNYMNLSTARSQQRAKEVGINKVLGSNSRSILFRFYTETSILVLFAVILGYLVALISLPFFSRIVATQLDYSRMLSSIILFGLFVVWISVTFVAGSYPAFYMSHISPLILMNKGILKMTIGNFVRKILVVFQFASSVILIVATIIIIQQIRFIKNKNLGYDPKGVLALSINAIQSKKQFQVAISDIKNISGIVNVSKSQSIPGNLESGQEIYKSSTDKEGYPIQSCLTDGAIVSTLDLKLLAGTSLPSVLADNDSNCYVLLNENVIKYLGFKSAQDAVGKLVNTGMSNKSIVSGVVKNFNYLSLKQDIGGYVYYLSHNASGPYNILLVRYNTKEIPQLMRQLQTVFKNDLNSTAFDYEFLDTHVQNLYASEKHVANAISIFSFLAIVVACIGLFGLAVFTAEQRTKEIGIRKVLGADLSSIIILLVKDFMKLVAIAFIVAVPIAWILMHQWLNGFVYRISISSFVFLAAGFLTMLIAAMTVTSLAIKTARSNPIKSLRTE